MNYNSLFDLTPLKECTISLDVGKSCASYFALANIVEYNANVPFEKCIKFIDGIEDNEYIIHAMKLLNRYNRADLIAYLLDKNKDVDKFGDFEL